MAKEETTTNKPIKKESRIKIKKKLWYKIVSPKLFGQREIGESYLTSPSAAIGRSMEVNLKNLTNNIKDQNIYITLRISKANGNVLQTSITGYEMVQSYVKRAVRKNTNRVDDYFLLKTKGGREVIAKTLIITASKTQQSIRTGLRKEFQKVLQEEMARGNIDSFVAGLVSRKILGFARKRMQKIYPVKEASVRVLKLKNQDLSNLEVEDMSQPGPMANGREGTVSGRTGEQQEESKETAAEDLSEGPEEQA
jgi:small subunit ribosomal protein S3Ae